MNNDTANNHTGHHKGNSTESLLDIPLILGELNVRPGQTIIDVGCGNGYMAKEFSKLVGQSGNVYALDRSKEAIEKLKGRTGQSNIEPLEADITQSTSLEKNAVDIIYLSTVFHIFSPEQTADFHKEVNRLLRPGGKLAVIEICKENTPFGPPLAMRYSPEELGKAIPLEPVSLVDVGQYFYMQVFKKL